MDYRKLFFLITLLSPVYSMNCLYKGQSVCGSSSTYFPSVGQSLAQIGRLFEVGPVEMERANEHITDPWFLYPWQSISVPARYNLPQEIHHYSRVVVVILDELRLYARFNDKVFTYSVGIGKEDTPTQEGFYKITKKIKNPTWYPPKNIIKQQKKLGVNLPVKIPPGPDNPLGTRGILFDKPGYLIHGTNYPGGVGRKSSAGCLRLENSAVEELFEYIDKGDKLIIKKKQ